MYSSFELNERVPAGRYPKLISFLAVRLADELLAWIERTRQRRQLGELDDHMLRDLGLSRSDIARETAKAFWQR
jgi:uncharacterized protein YjiS (DUF1127 family)